MLTWSNNCFLIAGTAANQVPIFTIKHTKLYVPVVTLSSLYHNVKLFKQLESGFKRTNNKANTKQFIRFLIDPRFQGVNHLEIEL